jgi:cytochrome d ubiquinol oxidase subunit I
MSGLLFERALHITFGALTAGGFAVAGYYANKIRRCGTTGPWSSALHAALVVAVPAAIIQPESGHFSAQYIAHHQPLQFAAATGQFNTEISAPLRIGGIPNVAARETRHALELPMGLSLLAFNNPFAEVAGLDSKPEKDWPPVVIVYLAFQTMFVFGSFISFVAGWVAWRWLVKKPVAESRKLLAALVISAPMGFVCVAAGLIVAVIGR